MKTYTLQEIVDDIVASSDIRLNICIEAKQDILYLVKYSETKTYKEQLHAATNKLSDKRKIKLINEYLESTINFPLGTYVPDGYEILLYEYYNNDGVITMVLSDRYELWTEKNLYKIMNEVNSFDFKSDTAVIFNIKEQYQTAFSKDKKGLN